MRRLRLSAFLGTVWLALSAMPARSAEMSFATVAYGADCGSECPRFIQANGTITPATPQAFLDFARREIDRPGLMNVVLIHSTGGSVAASLKLGRIFRSLGAAVVVARADGAGGRARRAADGRFVSGTCASACVYVLAGGVKRVVPPESRIAVHRMAGNVQSFDWKTWDYETRRVYAGDAEIATLTDYIRQMGVSTDLVSLAESVPHEHARVLSAREMARLKLAGTKF